MVLPVSSSLPDPRIERTYRLGRTKVVLCAPPVGPQHEYEEQMIDIAMENRMWNSVEFWGAKLQEKIG